ncbi:hypothetical protein BH11GEM2_BH11GEM2_39920 [soil metagenome]
MSIPLTQSVARAVAVVVTAGLLTSCSVITFDCGGSEYRTASVFGTVSDLNQTVTLEGDASLNEERGANVQISRQLVVGVQSQRTSNGIPVPLSVVGHLVRLRLERSDGTVVFSGTATAAARDEKTVLGWSVSNTLDADRFASIRDQLLANRLYIALEMDAGAPVLKRGALTVESSSDWRKHGCQ